MEGDECNAMDENLSNDGLDQARPIKIKRRGRRMIIGCLIAVAIIATVQQKAPANDHQIANLITIVVMLILSLQVLWNLHWIAVREGKKWYVPFGCAGCIALAPYLFRFDGFSGEIIPQISFRIGGQTPARQVEDASSGSGQDMQEGDSSTKDPVRGIALSDFPEFLGPERTGVIPTRQFGIPADASEIETLWNIGIGEGWASFAVVQDRAITLEQRDQEECLTCYRLEDGELLWIVRHSSTHYNLFGGSGPRSTPSIQGEHVFAQGENGRVWCVNWQTGEVQWSVDLLELANWSKTDSEQAVSWGRSGSPLLIDNLCVLPFGGPNQLSESGRSLIALSTETGEVQWTAGSDQISYSSAMLLELGGIRQIVSVNERTITGHRVEDGTQLWSHSWIGQSNGGANCASVIPAGKDQFIIGKGYGGGSALVRVTTKDSGTQTSEEIWTSSRVLKTKFTHACVDGRTAYAISNGALEAVNIADGESHWTQPRKERLGQGQLLLAEDTLIGQFESGGVLFAAASTDGFEVLCKLPAMRSKTWNIPTLAGRHLLVRNDRQAFCFLLPERKNR